MPEVDTQAEARFESGSEVGELAHQCFPGGWLVECKPWEVQKSIRDTQQIIQKGASIVYEAAGSGISKFQCSGVCQSPIRNHGNPAPGRPLVCADRHLEPGGSRPGQGSFAESFFTSQSQPEILPGPR